MKKTIILSLVVTFMGAYSTNANAGWHKKEHKKEKAIIKGEVITKKIMFEKKDINNDGYLTRREMESNIKYKFDYMDMNRDKYVSKKEMRTYNKDYRNMYKTKFEAANNYAQSKYQDNFKSIDMNNDKMVSHRELKEYYNKNHNFSMMDINNDGRISQKEFIEYQNTVNIK